MTRVRRPAVAGTFYPAHPEVLAAMVDDFVAAAGPPLPADEPPVSLVAPHAGFVYSGPVAGYAYAQLLPWHDRFDRVVLVGVPHRAPVRGLALSGDEAWDTPLGRVEVDTEAVSQLLLQRLAYLDDRAHADEHSLEVHLPFLQRVLAPGWRLVPVISGGPDTRAIADALEPWWGASGTLVIISTDLSHYHPHLRAQRIDRVTADDIVHGRWEDLTGDRACGSSGVRAALELTRRHGDQVTLLDLRTSGDTAGSDDRVVGYGSFAIR